MRVSGRSPVSGMAVRHAAADFPMRQPTASPWHPDCAPSTNERSSSMDPRNPHGPFYRAIAAVVAAVALGFAVTSHDVTATNALQGRVSPQAIVQATELPDYFPGRFPSNPGADEGD